MITRMAEEKKNKRYFWLKLENTYFKRLDQRKMCKQKNGYDMQRIYLKMMLLAVDKGGYIPFQSVLWTKMVVCTLEQHKNITHLQGAEVISMGNIKFDGEDATEIIFKTKDGKKIELIHTMDTLLCSGVYE